MEDRRLVQALVELAKDAGVSSFRFVGEGLTLELTFPPATPAAEEVEHIPMASRGLVQRVDGEIVPAQPPTKVANYTRAFGGKLPSLGDVQKRTES